MGARLNRSALGLLVGGTVLLGACSSTSTARYVAAGESPLCAPGADPLGVVAVLPETAWRADQKGPAERIAMARRALEDAFDRLPCGSLSPPGGIRPFSAYSDEPEANALEKLAAQGVETAVFVRIEELTPQIAVTLSLPFLWSSTSMADFRIRAVHIPSHAVRLDARVRRSTGGPFQLRPASWAEPELVMALDGVLSGDE